jgi:hypothetical protein
MTTTTKWTPITLPLRQVVAMICEWNTPWFRVMKVDIPGSRELIDELDKYPYIDDWDAENQRLIDLVQSYLEAHGEDLYTVSFNDDDSPGFTSRANYQPIRGHVSV